VPPTAANPHVLILGGGFGGLYAARELGRAGIRVTLADRRNFHLFQPLLYQVATGGLSPGDITSPIRSVLRRYRHVRVIQAEATRVDARERTVGFRDGHSIRWDVLIVATGSRTAYFGHDEWQARAPGLKSVEDALDIRQRVLGAFERAETETDPVRRDALLTFVVVGGGPTGVELAGTLAELARGTLARDFRSFDPRQTRVILLEGGERLLPALPASLSEKARASLTRLGVTVRTGAMVAEIGDDAVSVRGDERPIRTATVLWAAGVSANSFGARLAETLGVEPDRGGRIAVDATFRVAGHPAVYIIGDLARAEDASGRTLPGLAPVAMQAGRYVARHIRRGGNAPPFRYRDKGQLAVIGRNRAVAEFGSFRFAGFPAWLLWVFVHIMYLIGYDNRLLVLVQWAFDYVTRKRGARLITATGDDA
jgi:NADH dehydrogenase